jgi:hypothetical protein
MIGGPSGPLFFSYICCMASIDKVYRTVKNLANKEQKGFVTPAVFNRFAVIAQNNIYNELFTELVDAKKISRQNLDPGRDKSVRKRTLEDLSPFVTRVANYTDKAPNTNIFFKPTNFSRMISMSVGNTNGNGYNLNKTNIEIVYDVEKMDRILGSNLSTPTQDFPVALVSDEIEVFPEEIASIDITYYRTPGGMTQGGVYTDSPPQWTAIDSGGTTELMDPSSIDFMLPEHYSSELVYEIAKMIGISINDGGMVQIAAQEEARR